MTSEKIFVYLIVAVLVVFILAAAGWFSEHAVKNYAEASQATQSAYAQGRIDAQDSLTYRFLFARAQDATLVKGGALLASFLVVILGVLMVLEGSKAFYKLNVEGGGRKSALETSSPGLLMITLGLALAYGVMLYKTEFSLSASNPGQHLAAPLLGAAPAIAWSAPPPDVREHPLPAVAPAAPEKKREVPPLEKGPVATVAANKGPPETALVARPSSGAQPSPPTEVQRPPGSRMDVRVTGLQDTPSPSLPLELGAGLPASLPRLPLATSAVEH